MTKTNLSSFAVGMAVTYVNNKIEYPGRVIATDVKSGLPLVVAYEHLPGKEWITQFKADGTCDVSSYFVKRSPVVRYEYQNVYKTNRAVGRLPNREAADNAASVLGNRVNVLEFKYEDDVLVDARLTNDL